MSPFALLYGALFLHEPITHNATIFLALIVARILLVNGMSLAREARRLPRRPGTALDDG